MCGENFEAYVFAKLVGGSPPRVRGKRRMPKFESNRVRITPACAGKTFHRATGARRAQDHPRVCGENTMSAQLSMCPTGSPPRVRGKQAELLHIVIESRITPACAGKTPEGDPLSLRKRDHPRVCGENNRCHAVGVDYIGSPPRVRGKLLLAFACFFI